MTEALARAKPQIDDPKELGRVVRRLVEAFDPVAIYLFGSRARGEAGQDSDYDLMLVLSDDNERVRSRQDVWQTARSRRIFVNPFLTRAQSFAWRRHEVGTLDYEVQVDGIRLYPTAGADLRALAAVDVKEPGSMNAKVVAEWLERVRSDLVMARRACEGDDPLPEQAAYHVQQAAEKLTKAVLVAVQKRPRKGHQIGEFAKRLPLSFPDRERFHRPRPPFRLRLGASLSGRGPQPPATTGALRNRSAGVDCGNRSAQSRLRALAGAA